MTLHDQLQQLADTAPRPAIDHAVWDRGRALRRRDRIVTSAVVLAMVVILGGLVAVVTGPPRAFAPAGETVPEGAIPSRIYDVPEDAGLPVETDLAIGQASVVLIASTGVPVAIGATDGRYHPLDLPGVDLGMFLPPALSPDGTDLAWADTERSVVRLADLETGEVSEISVTGSPRDVRWTPDGDTLLVLSHRDDTYIRLVRIDLATGETTRAGLSSANAAGYVSPDGSTFALAGDQETYAAFAERGRPWRHTQRPLPTDVYPDGAAVQPMGWPDDHLVLATAGTPPGSDVEGRDLILFTSPDLPESEWTFRIVQRDLPSVPLSFAVDLIPDLDGTSGQQLTHDFGEPDWPGQRDISWIIGLGVAGALSVLYGLRWVWRRRTRLF